VQPRGAQLIEYWNPGVGGICAYSGTIIEDNPEQRLHHRPNYRGIPEKPQFSRRLLKAFVRFYYPPSVSEILFVQYPGLRLLCATAMIWM
jgi:hypothetical protein